MTKHFGSTVAVNDVSLNLSGKINLLLGSNGSGKSTFINLLAGLAFPDKGTLSFDDAVYDAKSKKEWRKGTEKLRNRARFWLEKPGLPQPMTGRDLLKFESGQPEKKNDNGTHELEKLAQNSFGSTVDLDKPISSYSSGMQQKLGIMATLIGEPELIVWDEPTATLDATSRAIVARLSNEFAAKGVTFLIASHIPGDFEGIADWIGLMKLGQLSRSGTLSELSNSDSESHDYIISTDRPSLIASRLMELGLVDSVSMGERNSSISLSATEKLEKKDIEEIAKQIGASYAIIQMRQKSITELYLESLA